VIQISPKPELWYKVFQTLEKYARTHKCAPADPPRALVLSGWIYSNDLERKTRWDETIKWASANNCLDIVKDIPVSEYYEVVELSTYPIGPLGGPMYLSWNYDEKTPPEALEQSLQILTTNWRSIAGRELSKITEPYMFSGKKARRLLVYYQKSYKPPWGDWSHLSGDESKRRTFTNFRAAVNKAISPHMVDHINFSVISTFRENKM
jgi:hypothetical protein